MTNQDSANPLDRFLPPVREWFRATFGAPTPAQRESWPIIASGNHTLILAPTGSGKTLAAFLACLNGLWRQDPPPTGVRVLYISPLKALNNDIYRNLKQPLQGVAATAMRMGFPLPTITTAVRTGDTPAAERQRLIRKPPHVLITTPESLNILLTSRARETLRHITHCIVDEIHALCPNKRGVFLSLLLERLEALNPQSFTRIGLSATQRPLEEVGRYLGGFTVDKAGGRRPRPVTIVDTGTRKGMDLKVVSPVEQFGPLAEKSVWPSVYRLLANEIRTHRSTIIFANNRRTVERITANLNEIFENNDSISGEEDHGEQADAERSETNAQQPVLVKAHHGSVSLEVRQETEQALKEGRLSAVVATASLELGIDMGAVELVCQVESPGSIARGLQRVGRAGHLVGQTSKGRLIPKTPADLLEQAVLAGEMAQGHVEEVRVPTNCLDVLAQQLIALVAVDAWEAPALYALVRCAYPYRDLSPELFESVLEMISGRFKDPAIGRTPEAMLRAMQPRVSWDRVHNRVLALPGSRQMAIVGGGTIPDTGQYAAISTKGVRIGELDEEFIYERRVGDAFLLGTTAWRLEKIETDRVLVSPAAGAPAIVPFWRGENAGRSHDLSMAMGRFLHDLAGRANDADCLTWLESQYHLDPVAARELRRYVKRQLDVAGFLPTDQSIAVEASRDPLGDWQVIVLSPFGSRLHLALRLALEGRLRQRLGYRPQILHHDDGLLIRLTDTDEPILDVFDGLTPENLEGLVLEELSDSALFAMRFRQNAARALMFPRSKPGQRAPLWLQRLRGRDLLQVARLHSNFPIVVETFRECLQDHLDLPRLRNLLSEIQAGKIAIKTRRAETPSPFANSILFSFVGSYMYERNPAEVADRAISPLNQQLLDQLITPERHEHLLDPRAIHQVERRLRGIGHPPRTATEMAEWLRRLGDLTPSELEGPMASLMGELQADNRATTIELPRISEATRWILIEEEPLYRSAFGMENVEASAQQAAAETILRRFLETHALVGLEDVLRRYPFEPAWTRRKLEDWAAAGQLVQVAPQAKAPSVQWSAPANLQQVQRGTLALLRSEVITCSPPQFADFVLRWQRIHPSSRTGTIQGFQEVLDKLEGLALPGDIWERLVLPNRVLNFQSRWLDEVISSGEWSWIARGEASQSTNQVMFYRRSTQRQLPLPESEEAPALNSDEERLLAYLKSHGASFVSDMAQDLDLTPGLVRTALWNLARRGWITNDRFEAIRKGETRERDASSLQGALKRKSPIRRSPRSSIHTPLPEGRWSIVPWRSSNVEGQAFTQANLLLHRYGIVARELALLDPSMLPWRVLYEVLSRMEMGGAVRRGYLVEGLSGAQFALPEALEMAEKIHTPSTAADPVVLLHSLDPANLYGTGAPFDIPLLDGGTRHFLRRMGNWLVVRAGKPLLLIEGQGRRLTALASASRADVAASVACLPEILKGEPKQSPKHKLTVEEWNGQPVTAIPEHELLQAVGFVRDYQAMTLYAEWK
ncbi:MAG: DEAD/DEAH box helicase [Gemmataceae bacterium]